MRDDSWVLRAACRDTDPEIFYSGQEQDTRAALALCRSCEVRATCFEVSVHHGEHFGVWGGVPESQRRRLIRRRLRDEGTTTAA